MNSDCDDPLSLHSDIDTVSSEIEAVSDDILDNNDNNDKVDSDILDDVVDSVEEDPAKQQLLSRLSEEHQQDECPSVSTRINFGIQEYKEPETHITIENSMRRVLNLGNEKEKKKRRKPAKQIIDKGYAGMENTRRPVPKETNHRLDRNIKKTGKSDATDGLRKPFRDINLENEKVPEISPSGIKLNSLTSDGTKTGFSLQNLSKSTSSGPGLNLNSLAQQHLNSSNHGPDNRPGLNLSSLALAAPKVGSGLGLGSQATGPGLSLSSLAENHLSQKTSSPGLSLTSLANHHLSEQPNNKSSLSLSNNSLSSGLGGLGLKGGLSSSNSGLSGLAQLHLQDQGASTANKSGFTIPSLFGSAPPPSAPPPASSVTPPNLSTPSPPRIKTPEPAIDLSSALRSLSSYDLEKSPEPLTAFSPGKTQILVEDLNMSAECSIRKRKCSPLGEVVVRRWSRRKVKEPQVVVVVEPRQVLEGFKFDVPSPDEAVLLAQAKAFNRPSLASSAISRNTLGKAAVK